MSSPRQLAAAGGDAEASDEGSILSANPILSALAATRVEPLWWVFAGCTMKDIFGFNIIHALCVSPLSDSHIANLMNEAFDIARVISDGSLAAAAAAADISGGWTPLHFCCARGRGEVIDALISNGVSLSPPQTLSLRDLYMSCSSNSTTPLHLAIEYAPIAVSRKLLNHMQSANAHSSIVAATASATDGDGVSVLQAGIRGGGGSAVLNLLLPLIAPNMRPNSSHGVSGSPAPSKGAAPAPAAAADEDDSVQKFSGTVEACASVGAVKLMETIIALPGVSRIRNVFGFSVHRAVEQGDSKTLRRLLLLGAGLGSVACPLGVERGGGWGVLHFAAALGDADILEYLLQRGCDKDINMQDYSGFTALHLAVHRGRHECAKLLLTKGANHAVLAAGGLSVLHVAVARGDTTMLQILSQKNLNFVSPSATATIISIACTSYSTATHGPSMLSFLLNGDARAQLLSRDYSQGLCALAVAARAGDPSLFLRLLDSGASSRTVSYDGRDVVSHAAASASGNAAVIMSILSAAGVSFTRPSCLGKRPLHYIAEHASVEGITLFLRQAGVKKYINDPDFSGYTPFLCAVQRGRREACALLQQQGAILSSTTDMNENCLHIACANGHSDLVAWLLLVVPPEYIYAKASDALPDCVAAAVHSQSVGILSSLLQLQVRPPPGWDTIPLKLAASCSNAAIMRTLMDAGASVERSGESLLAMSVKHGHASVVELLMKRANAVYLQGNWSPAFSPLCYAIIHSPPPPSHSSTAHAILDGMQQWDSRDIQRVLLHIDPSTGFSALPLALAYGHADVAERIIDLDDRTYETHSSSANHTSPVRTRVYADGLTAACFAAGGGNAGLLKRILGAAGCDLSVVCAAAGRGQFLHEKFPRIVRSTPTGSASHSFEQVLQLALAASQTSRIDINEVWNGRQPLWFACRTGDLAAAHALLSASATVKPALTTEVKFKLNIQRHHTPLQAAAASGDEKMINWLLTCVFPRKTNSILLALSSHSQPFAQVCRGCEGDGAGGRERRHRVSHSCSTRACKSCEVAARCRRQHTGRESRRIDSLAGRSSSSIFIGNALSCRQPGHVRCHSRTRRGHPFRLQKQQRRQRVPHNCAPKKHAGAASSG